MNMLKLSVSNANSKMGSIKSISMPRIKTCAPGVPCAKTCYVSHFDWRTTVRNAYDNNLNLWLTDPDGFEVQATAAAYGSFYFRWHVSGDIVDEQYFDMMCRIANKLPRTQFLAFTKKYDLVNAFLDKDGMIPCNLHILFSSWPSYTMNNPTIFQLLMFLSRMALAMLQLPPASVLVIVRIVPMPARTVGSWVAASPLF